MAAMPQVTNNGATVTLEGVELARVGSWNASTGPVTLTAEDFDAVVAAAGDPDLDAPAIRLGHSDPRFDGEPAMGWVANPRLSDDRTRLLGDLVDVPVALADVIPLAFRRRSVELAWGVRTAAGKAYRMVLTGLALLGVQPPAVKGLADVLALYGKRTAAAAGPATITAASFGALESTVAITDPLHAAELAVRTIAAADGTTIPTSNTTTGQHGPDDAPRGGQQVNEQRIRELMGVEANVDLEAAVTELVSRANATATAPAGAGDAAGTTTPAGTATTPPAGTTTAPAGTAPAGAPAATTTAPPAAGTAGPAAAPAAGQVAAAAGANPAHAHSIAVPGQAPGTVTLAAGVLEQLQAGSVAGTAALAELARQDRERTIAAALSAGRIAPNDVAGWTTRLEHDDLTGVPANAPHSTRTLLSALTPAFATTELGGSGPTAILAAGDEAAWAAFDDFLGIEAAAPAGKAGV